ncbi:hypothetical protein [Prochlorococcus marinus]|uniref:hypothetical protein n=1 Tax=Prochlorococcus marinus TaxID=1219 RepID=UPI0022B3C0B6|nr:hypothetical protein [Prochlorococcus marinus]
MDPLKTKLDALLREELTENAVLCAVIIIGLRRGFNPYEQSDFYTPWGKAPDSKEEEAFQDLVWFHKVLPPHATFDPAKAKRGFYTKLRWKKQDEFYSKYIPEEEREEVKRHIPKTFNPQIKPQTSLKTIRRKLSEENHVF